MWGLSKAGTRLSAWDALWQVPEACGVGRKAIVKPLKVSRFLSAFCLLKKKKGGGEKATNKAVSQDPTCN